MKKERTSGRLAMIMHRSAEETVQSIRLKDCAIVVLSRRAADIETSVGLYSRRAALAALAMGGCLIMMPSYSVTHI